MRKNGMIGFVLLTLLLAAVITLNAPAEAAEPAEDTEALRLAEAALRLPLEDVPVLGEEKPMPEGMVLCGPYLYMAPAESGPDELYIPGSMSRAYEPGGLPSGAVIRTDGRLIQGNSVPEGARAVFPLLYCPGYSSSTSYINLGTVYYQTYSVLLIDRVTGEVAAQINGPRRKSTSQLISKGDYREDMNGNLVFRFTSTPKNLKDIWLDTFAAASVNGYTLIMEDSNVTAMLGDTRSSGGELVIPDGTAGIGKQAFTGREEITSVRFPDSLTSVGERAFEGCGGLRELVLPEGVSRISNHAFDSCTGLEKVSLPGSMKELYYGCFAGCKNLAAIDLPAGLQEIGNMCFSGCEKLTQITVPRNIREILSSCFYGCKSLERVEFAGPVRKIENYAFGGCSSLKTLSFTGETAFVGQGAFSDCDSLEEISFSVTRRSAGRNWDKNWKEGCTAKIT